MNREPRYERPNANEQYSGWESLRNLRNDASDSGWDALSDSTPETTHAAVFEQNLVRSSVRQDVESLVGKQERFAARLESLSAEGKRLLPEQFALREKMFSRDWEDLERQLSYLKLHGSERTVAIAELELPYTRTAARLGEQAIEVQAGNYYKERRDALRDAITTSNSPTKDADLDTMQDLYHCAAVHVDHLYESRNIGEMSMLEAEQYYNERQNAHDNLIRRLNSVNDLARQYGTTPLTPRNFWTSAGSSKIKDQAVEEKMLCDRAQVESYCRHAFSPLFSQAEQKAAAKQRYFRD